MSDLRAQAGIIALVALITIAVTSHFRGQAILSAAQAALALIIMLAIALLAYYWSLRPQ